MASSTQERPQAAPTVWSRPLQWTLFGLLLSYVAFGMYPFGFYEADGETIAMGIGFVDAPERLGIGGAEVKEAVAQGVAYRFESQSGTYVVSVLLQDLTGLSYFASFSVATALG